MANIKITGNNVELILKPDERAALDWMQSVQPGKFEKWLTDYFKSRIINMNVNEEREIISNMSEQEKENVRTRIRNKKNAG
jgi:(p)ppGpp synthase/HD superfamily hydrolase